jgi:hypothetical protein
MDKARHPHVIRTWRVERTKVPYRPPQSGNPPYHPLYSGPRRPEPKPHPPAPPPEKQT